MHKICKTTISVFFLMSCCFTAVTAQNIQSSFTINAIPSANQPFFSAPTFVSPTIQLDSICNKTAIPYIELNADELTQPGTAEALSFIHDSTARLAPVAEDAKWNWQIEQPLWFGTTFVNALSTTIQFPDLRTSVTPQKYCRTFISIPSQLTPYRVVLKFNNSSRRYFGTLIRFLPSPSVPVIHSTIQ